MANISYHNFKKNIDYEASRSSFFFKFLQGLPQNNSYPSRFLAKMEILLTHIKELEKNVKVMYPWRHEKLFLNYLHNVSCRGRENEDWYRITITKTRVLPTYFGRTLKEMAASILTEICHGSYNLASQDWWIMLESISMNASNDENGKTTEKYVCNCLLFKKCKPSYPVHLYVALGSSLHEDETISITNRLTQETWCIVMPRLLYVSKEETSQNRAISAVESFKYVDALFIISKDPGQLSADNLIDIGVTLSQEKSVFIFCKEDKNSPPTPTFYRNAEEIWFQHPNVHFFNQLEAVIDAIKKCGSNPNKIPPWKNPNISNRIKDLYEGNEVANIRKRALQ